MGTLSAVACVLVYLCVRESADDPGDDLSILVGLLLLVDRRHDGFDLAEGLLQMRIVDMGFVRVLDQLLLVHNVHNPAIVNSRCQGEIEGTTTGLGAARTRINSGYLQRRWTGLIR